MLGQQVSRDSATVLRTDPERTRHLAPCATPTAIWSRKKTRALSQGLVAMLASPLSFLPHRALGVYRARRPETRVICSGATQRRAAVCGVVAVAGRGESVLPILIFVLAL